MTNADVPDDDVPVGDFSPEQDYWQALGHFVEAFAMAEGMLFMYLIHSIGIDKMVGKALFGRARCAELIGLVRRTWKARPPAEDIEREVSDLLEQFAHIDNA